MIPFTKNY